MGPWRVQAEAVRKASQGGAPCLHSLSMIRAGFPDPLLTTGHKSCSLCPEKGTGVPCCRLLGWCVPTHISQPAVLYVRLQPDKIQRLPLDHGGEGLRDGAARTYFCLLELAGTTKMQAQSERTWGSLRGRRHSFPTCRDSHCLWGGPSSQG